jgi:cytochrome c553
MKWTLIALVIAVSLTSCKKSTKKENDNYIKLKSTELNSEEIAARGKTLMQNKCYLCHSPKAAQKSMIAPPMIALKARYTRDADTKEEFIADLWNFVEKPTHEKAKLKGAVKRFGLMPYQPYQQKDIEAIAAFMYDYEIEKPEWFQEHWKKNHGKGYKQKGKSVGSLAEPEQSYAEIGISYAKSTKQTLGKNLMGAIQKEGVLHALSFCNVQAMPLTDSMATKHNAIIKRVSDKFRNPKNKANEVELEYISLYKQILENGEEPEPMVVEEGKNVNFYYPIVTNDMCLKCHGTPGQEIERETYDKIKELYPQDKAIGYGVNEVRGMWSINFSKNE